jgi:MFS superfamily sulfate permease-like transporter
VITLDVLPALIIGVLFSLAVLIFRASRPPVSLLGADPAVPGTFEDLGRHPGATSVPGVLIVRPDAALFYANAEAIRDTVESQVSSSDGQVHTAIFDLDANDDLDITSAEQLGKLADNLAAQNVALGIAHVHQPVEHMAAATGLLEKIGTDHIFPNIAAAVQWAQQRGSTIPPLDRRSASSGEQDQ